MRYLLILLSMILSSCGQAASSSDEASQIDPALIESPVEDVDDLSGRKIVYIMEHPFQPERFETSGEWQTVVHMAGPVGFTGSWKQEGSQICVEIEHSDWRRIEPGETVCRDIQVRDGSLFLVPMTDIEEGREFEITIKPL